MCVCIDRYDDDDGAGGCGGKGLISADVCSNSLCVCVCVYMCVQMQITSRISCTLYAICVYFCVILTVCAIAFAQHILCIANTSSIARTVYVYIYIFYTIDAWKNRFI